MSNYTSFLESKRISTDSVGFSVDPSSLHPALKPFQRKIVQWALHRGRAALFEDTGMGKTLQFLVWAQQVHEYTGQNVLILAPLAVAQQTVREGEKWGISVRYAHDQSEVKDGITVTNYDRLEKFDPSTFGGIVLDECFSPLTLIDVVDDCGIIRRKHIKDIQVGEKIINAYGVDTVSDVHRREVPYAVKVTIKGESIVCSPNHPFFTQRGWIGAQDLVPGDHALATTSAMRLVWNRSSAKVSVSKTAKVLREVLLSEMADVSTGAPGESSQSRSRQEARREEKCLAGVGQSKSQGRNREGSQSESYSSTRSEKEDLPPIERDAPRTFRAWGEWEGINRAAEDTAGCAWRRLDSGICFVTGQTDSRLSHELQDRLSEYRSQNRYRSGWAIARQSQGTGPEEGRETDFYGVDSLEVLEPGHPELESLRAEDGKLYFYDLGATRHPSFSVNGLLVHNSSILKSYGGATRQLLTEFSSTIPYRLACTATPAPNDLIEIINHAEFLGVMQGKEIIALFFTQDGNTTHAWRLKGHARREFYKWLASWSVALRKPSDLGFEDDGYILPPLHTQQIVVEGKPVEGSLFAIEALTLQERRGARRASQSDRVKICADLVNASDEAWIVWCDLNSESEALRKAIPGAVEVKGADTPEHKQQAMIDFAEGRVRVLVSKPSICGFGMNFQHCRNVAFVGLSDSFEQYYQAVRRCWRFGQTRPVNCYIIASECEGAVLKNIERKERQAREMIDQLVKEMSGLSLDGQAQRDEMDYSPVTRMVLPPWLCREEKAAA